MPNWCDAYVFIYANSAEELGKLLEKAAEGTHKVGTDWDKETREYKTITEVPNVFSFENFLPTPPELLEGQGWYDWRVDNWGTKWDLGQDAVSIGQIEPTNDPDLEYKYQVGLGFQTAWSPALPVFQKIASDFDVYIEYKFIEEGMAFFGIARIDKDGTEEDVREPSIDDYKIAGCVIDENGEIDWEATDEYDLYIALDAWIEEFQEEEKEKSK